MVISQSVFLEASDLAVRLKAGSPALLPTDTLPALAAIPEFAVQLWTIKGRPTDKPLILMGATAEELLEHASPIALEDARSMARRFWPGAVTLVVPAFGEVVEALNPGGETLGMRLPDCGLIRCLLNHSGPLATTSANISGANPTASAETAAECFPGLPLLAPLPWPNASGMASTVLAWQGPGRWEMLRAGAVEISF